MLRGLFVVLLGGVSPPPAHVAAHRGTMPTTSAHPDDFDPERRLPEDTTTFDPEGAKSPISDAAPTFDPFADEAVPEAAAEGEFYPKQLKFDPGAQRIVLPLFDLRVGIFAHWWDGSDDLQTGTLACFGRSNGCPLCICLGKPSPEVILPVIEIGRNAPCFIKMKMTGRKSGQPKAHAGISLWSQIETMRSGHDWTKTALRIRKDDNRFAVSARPMDSALMPPSWLLEKFRDHMKRPHHEIFGDFVRYIPPSDLREYPSVAGPLGIEGA